jgi:hypothetical protein
MSGVCKELEGTSLLYKIGWRELKKVLEED